MRRQILIQNAHVVPGSGPELPGTDVLCADGVITAVGRRLTAPDAAVIDATGLTVTAGLVDAHRHVWQAPLRGTGADMPMARYFTDVLGAALSAMSPADAAEATLLGARAALRAGVTTVFDYSNAADLSPAHAEAVLDAFERSGIRAVVATGTAGQASAGTAGSRVTGALSMLGPEYGDWDTAAAAIRHGRDRGLMVAAHVAGPCVRRLHEEGLLGPHLQLVHLNAVTPEDAKLLAGSGTAVVVTPAVEAVMGHGASAYHRLADAGARPAFGADVVINNPPDLFEPLRDTLRTLRLAHGSAAVPPAAELLRAATLHGAAAAGLGGVVGAVEVGRRADLLLLDGFGHLTGDRAGAVVSCGTAADVHTVLVDGRVVVPR